MALDAKTIGTLQKLGLTSYEAKAYTALVGTGTATAKMLSSESGVPRPKIYAALQRLEEEKWITASKGKPSTYIPRYPSEVVEERKALLCSELDELSNTLTSLYDRQIENEALNALLIRGIDGISAKMLEMMDRAWRSVMIVGTFFSAAEIDQLNKKIIKARRKEVTVRIFVTSLLKDSEADILQAFARMKADVRRFARPIQDQGMLDDGFNDRPAGFVRWMIIDRREVLLSVAMDDEGASLDSAIAIWVSNASIARYLMGSLFFDRLWELSEPLN